MTTFTRITVVGTARRAELVVPDDEPVGGLVPTLMELLEEPTGSVARPLALVRPTGEQLDAALSAAEQDLVDGEQLRLVRADEAPPPPEVADVTDVVGDSFADRPGRWSTLAREALGAVAVGTAAAVAALVARPGLGTWLVVLAVLAVAAVVAGRTGHRWTALALTAAAAGAVVAAPLVVGSLPDADALTWGGAGVLLVWLVLGAGVGVALRDRAALAGAAVGAVLAGLLLLTRAAGLPVDHALALTGVASVVVCGLLPWYALSSSGLTGLDDQVLAGRPGRRAGVVRTVDEAYRVLGWATVAVAVPLGAAAALLLTSPERWAVALGGVLAGVTALRTRAFPLVVQQVALALAALSAAVTAALGPVGAFAARRGELGPVVLLAVAALVVAVGVGARPAEHQRARLRRLGNLAEAVGVIALLPLLLGVFGVFADLLGAFR